MTIRKLYRDGWNGETPELSHKELVDRAFGFLKGGLNCSVTFKERRGSTTENPDAIGFRQGFSFLIECKASRGDFLSDKKKPFRKRPQDGMGYERYFMAPVGMLEPSEMPESWGLIEVYPKARKNHPVKVAKNSEPFNERNLRAEVSYLVSSIRRIEISMAVFIEKEMR